MPAHRFETSGPSRVVLAVAPPAATVRTNVIALLAQLGPLLLEVSREADEDPLLAIAALAETRDRIDAFLLTHPR